MLISPVPPGEATESSSGVVRRRSSEYSLMLAWGPYFAPVPDADLLVRLQARAKRNTIVDQRGGVLRVSVAAAPVQGQANAALCKLIAKRAGVARGRVTVVRGARSRDKVVRVEGLTRDELRRALGLVPE